LRRCEVEKMRRHENNEIKKMGSLEDGKILNFITSQVLNFILLATS
jgi:hypothetical protein